MDTSKNAVIIFSKECLRSRHWMSIISDHLRTYFLVDNSLYTVKGQDVERLFSPECPSGVKKNILMSSIHIVIISQAFLSHVMANSSETLFQLFEDQSVIVLLVDVNEEKDIKEAQLQVMPGYFRWTRVKTNDDDTAFTKIAVSEHVHKFLERMQKQQESKAKFELHPSKIYRDRTKVAAMLQEPQEQMTEDIEVKIRCQDLILDAENPKWINPYAISFKVPAIFFNFTGPLCVEVKVDQQSQGNQKLHCITDHDRTDMLLNEEPSNVVENLCQLLGLDPGNYDELDNFLAEGLRPSVPVDRFSWLNMGLKPSESSVNQFPTLLHFACQFGLERFVSVLLDCPGAVEAIRMKNVNDMDCIEVAKYFGHYSLCSYLQVYIMFFDMQKELQEPETKKDGHTLSCMEDDQMATSIDVNQTEVLEQTSEVKPVEETEATSKRKKSSYLGELRDVLEGFKEGEFTLKQAEMLVQWWKERPDVQRENLTREEQLEAMRKEYRERAKRSEVSKPLPTGLFSKLKLLGGNKSSKPVLEIAKASAVLVQTTTDLTSALQLASAEPAVGSSSPSPCRHSAGSLPSEARALDDEGLPESCTTSNASLIDEEESPYMVMQAPRSADSSLQKSIW